jgi:hypothetical protein
VTGKPIGSLVGLYYDSPRTVVEGDYLQTSTGRTYLISDVRRQVRGARAGRWHLKCIVVNADDVAAGAVVHPVRWYRR